MELLSNTRRWSDNEYLGRLAGWYHSSYLVKLWSGYRRVRWFSRFPSVKSPRVLDTLCLAFKHSHKIGPLSRRVNFLGYDLLELKGAELIFPEALRRLATSLIVRCSLLRRIEDLYQIYLGQLENAIEICEQRRALLWSEMPACPIDERIEV